MSSSPQEWTLQGFVDHFDFIHRKMLDHKFVWVLGAGASLASGIPLGSDLVDRWLKELHVREHAGETRLEEWATAGNLEIDDFEYEKRASFYPEIYERRFRDFPEAGYAYLENEMAGADPSPGYSILAAALAGDPPERPSRHNAVITTNFDNLVADALSIYTDTFPFVCGHESLTPFVNVAMRRPLVCKIHRDLLMAPQNDSRSLKRLRDPWGSALGALFENYTPLFIGYGGNDDTLMDLLESLRPDEIKGQMIWCYHEGGKPSERILKVVEHHRGVMVPVPDFDLLMVLLGERMGIRLLDEEIGRRAKARTKKYRERIQRLDTVKHPEVVTALAATFARSGGWWAWDQKAESEKDPANREKVYRQGIEIFPDSAGLHSNFAVFMKNVRGDHDEAEQLYRKALELDPNLLSAIGNFALFMTHIRGDHDEAERLYRKALKLDPKRAVCLSSLASFLTEVRDNHDEAEPLYRKAIELEPLDPNWPGNYASFLIARGRLDESETKLDEARTLNYGEEDQLAAEIALHSAILARLRNEDDNQALVELRQLLSDGFRRGNWSFESVLAYAKEKVAPEDHALHVALAGAILDEENVPAALEILDKRLSADAASPDEEDMTPENGIEESPEDAEPDGETEH